MTHVGLEVCPRIERELEHRQRQILRGDDYDHRHVGDAPKIEIRRVQLHQAAKHIGFRADGRRRALEQRAQARPVGVKSRATGADGIERSEPLRERLSEDGSRIDEDQTRDIARVMSREVAREVATP